MNDPLVVLPNLEALLSAFLRDQPELDGVDVRTVFGDTVAYPAIRITLIADEKVTSEPLWIVRGSLQIEAYADRKAEAYSTAAMAEGVIAARVKGEHATGIVAGVDIAPKIYLPDDEYEPAKHRYITGCTLVARPLATITS
jgi:hypothetical protein